MHQQAVVLGLIAAHLLVTHNTDLGAEELDLLCETLFLEADDKREICQEWNDIKETHFPDMIKYVNGLTAVIVFIQSHNLWANYIFVLDIFREMLSSVRSLVRLCIPRWGKPIRPKWIYLVPLLHFLDGTCSPYKPLQGSVEHNAADGSWWGVKTIQSFVEKYKLRTSGFDLKMYVTTESFALTSVLPEIIKNNLRTFYVGKENTMLHFDWFSKICFL